MEEEQMTLEAEFDIVEPDIEKPEFEVVESDGVAKVEITNFSDPIMEPSQVGSTVELRKSVVYGSARININEMTAYVDKKIAEVKALDIATADTKDIKATQAQLNKLAISLNDARIALDKEWTEPFKVLVADPIKELIKKIEDGKKPVADKLAEIDGKRIAARQQEIAEIKTERLSKESETVHAAVAKMEWFDDPKWLNSTTTAKKIGAEIDEKVTKIVVDLKAFVGVFGPQLLESYIRTGDLGRTLAERDRLKAAAEEYNRVEAERRAERERRVEEQRIEAERLKAVRDQYVNTAEEDAQRPTIGNPNYVFPGSDTVPKKEQLFIYGFEVRCTAAQRNALSAYLRDNNIPTKKIKEQEVQA